MKIWNKMMSLYTYFGNVMRSDGQCTLDIKRTISLASAVIGKLHTFRKSNSISLHTKMKVYEILIVSLLYKSACWCLLVDVRRELQ